MQPITNKICAPFPTGAPMGVRSSSEPVGSTENGVELLASNLGDDPCNDFMPELPPVPIIPPPDFPPIMVSIKDPIAPPPDVAAPLFIPFISSESLIGENSIF